MHLKANLSLQRIYFIAISISWVDKTLKDNGLQRLRTDDEIAPIYVRKVAQQAPFNYKVPFNYDLDELLLLNIGCSRRDLIELRSKDTLLKAMKLAIKFYNLEDEPVSIFPKKKQFQT